MSKVLITGSSKGIGRAIARELAGRGHEVIATARRVDALADLAVARRVALDVTDDDSVRRARDEVGPIDVLVNNAAEIALGPIESIPLSEIQRLYDVNVFGALRTIQAFAPAMRERRAGTIVNISSVAGRVGFPLNGAYSSTKWALEGISEALRFELAHFGVRVVLVEPGAVSSGALDQPRTYLGDPYLPLGATAKFDPAQMITPEAVAQVVADAIAEPSPALRWPAGAAAGATLAARRQLDDDAFEASLRQRLAPAW